MYGRIEYLVREPRKLRHKFLAFYNVIFLFFSLNFINHFILELLAKHPPACHLYVSAIPYINLGARPQNVVQFIIINLDLKLALAFQILMKFEFEKIRCLRKKPNFNE